MPYATVDAPKSGTQNKMFWDRWFTPPKDPDNYKKAYKEKKPYTTWYEWMTGLPTGYDKKSGFNYGGLSGMGALDGSIDWRKSASGSKTGLNYGNSISPGWGSVIGAVAGGAAGSTFTGGEDYNEGMAASAEGRATDPYWSKWNEPFKYMNTAVGIYGMGRGMGMYGSDSPIGGYGDTTSTQYAPMVSGMMGQPYGGNSYLGGMDFMGQMPTGSMDMSGMGNMFGGGNSTSNNGTIYLNNAKQRMQEQQQMQDAIIMQQMYADWLDNKKRGSNGK